MINFPVDGFLWFLACLIPLIFVQRWLSRELQLVLLLLARKQAFALGLYSLLLFPGVLLHELSHLLMAKILFVRTGQISIFPKLMPDGFLRMGYVEVEKTDIFRSALIGAAPILAGVSAVSYLWTNRLGLRPLVDLVITGKLAKIPPAFVQLTSEPLFWVWFYLALAVSITMLPSRSDRRSWLSFAVAISLLIGLGILAGMGGWLTTTLAPWFNQRLFDLVGILSTSLGLQAILGLIVAVIRSLLSQVIRFPDSVN